jgi:hypothetical protein
VAAPELIADRPATGLFRCWSTVEEQVTAMIMEIGRPQHEAHLRELSWRIRSGR